MSKNKANEEKESILKRKFISLEEKVNILDRLENGEKIVVIANSLNLNESTIRTIKHNEHKIRESICAGSAVSAKRVSRVRNAIIEEMEKHLIIWIEDCNEKRIPLHGKEITQKALKIFTHLKELEQASSEKSPEREFCASKGWLEKFKKRYCIKNVKVKESETKCSVNEFDLSKLREGLHLAKTLGIFFTNNDPSSERSEIFRKQLEICLTPYNELVTQLTSRDQRTRANSIVKPKPVIESEGVKNYKNAQKDLSDKNPRALNTIIIEDSSDDD